MTRVIARPRTGGVAPARRHGPGRRTAATGRGDEPLPLIRVTPTPSGRGPTARGLTGHARCSTVPVVDAPSIRTLGTEDVEALIRLWNEAGLVTRPAGRDAPEALRDQMSVPRSRFFGACDAGGGLTGAAIATHDGRKGWINRLAVRPAARRSGVARLLLERCETWLFGEGILIVAALVEGDNRPSQALFEACAYERDDTLVYFRKLRRPAV